MSAPAVTSANPALSGEQGQFDAVFLSVDEPLADELFARVVRVLGSAKRLHGIRPMRRAYRLCAMLADTDQFWLVDGDLELAPTFPADQIPPLDDTVAMRVWKTRNPVNGLIYGYGGLKLVRTAALHALDDVTDTVDVLAALPGRVEFASDVAGTTRIDQSRYHAWKAGFRECAMLARGCEYGSPGALRRDDRIAAWLASGTGPFAIWATRGAVAGVAFAAATDSDDNDTWDRINDPRWLRDRFVNSSATRRRRSAP